MSNHEYDDADRPTMLDMAHTPPTRWERARGWVFLGGLVLAAGLLAHACHDQRLARDAEARACVNAYGEFCVVVSEARQREDVLQSVAALLELQAMGLRETATRTRYGFDPVREVPHGGSCYPQVEETP